MPVERESGENVTIPDEGLIGWMDDFQVIAERRRVMTALAALTDHYRALNHEIQRRETLKWMTAPR
jgi:hypothetical protein